jgi:hypothetical protein
MLAPRLSLAVAGLLLIAGAAPAEAPPATSPEGVEFFESKVRPVLAENCFACHGPEKQKGGLRLDSRSAALKGGETGPAVVPGKPDESPMLRAVGYTDSNLQMPPKGKLPAAKVEALTAWVKMGAPWPATPSAAAARGEGVKPHWAFQPVREPALPTVRDAAWATTPLDQFVLAKLEAKGLRPSAPADKRTLIRRVTYDLTGLPPTPEETDAFLADRSPDAYERVVDRLLASPRYGERWGRHWLDVARYADSKGYVFQEERRFPFAYTYRDWVIRAFNEDLPYDRFVVQQLAADRLPVGEDKRPLAAMGYLTLGRRFLNNQADIIDDRLDVVCRGFLGLTVGCARCHDHKFDPVPQKDYYSLYGVFASAVEPKELPLLGAVARTPAEVAFEKELARLEADVQQFLRKRHAELVVEFRRADAIAAYLLAARDGRRNPAGRMGLARERGLNGYLLGRWAAYLDGPAKGDHPVFGPWNTLSALGDGEFTDKAPALLASFTAPSAKVNAVVKQSLAAQKPASARDLAKAYGEVLAEAGAAAGVTTPERAELRRVVIGPDAPPEVPLAQVEQAFNRADRDKAKALRKKIEALQATSPAAPPRAMALVDAPTPVAPRVFLRGNPNNPGEAVPRQFLGVLTGPDRKPFTDGSGRLELAKAIASKDNPLTARVFVNRVWAWHFGRGIVGTTSDFGTRSEPPSHPELLDWLADRFVADGWSVKRLHRLIVLSATYRQASADRPDLATADPENRLLGRFPRQRLDLEELRDSLLAVAGRLDPTMGGPAVDLVKAPFTARRTVYGFIDRQNLPGLFRAFDFASPDTHAPQRFQTTVPQQALFLMNSPFVQEQARALAKRTEGAATPAERVALLYRLAYGRRPTGEESALGLGFVSAPRPTDAGSLGAWEEYAQVLLLGNEFAFAD